MTPEIGGCQVASRALLLGFTTLLGSYPFVHEAMVLMFFELGFGLDGLDADMGLYLEKLGWFDSKHTVQFLGFLGWFTMVYHVLLGHTWLVQMNMGHLYFCASELLIFRISWDMFLGCEGEVFCNCFFGKFNDGTIVYQDHGCCVLSLQDFPRG